MVTAAGDRIHLSMPNDRADPCKHGERMVYRKRRGGKIYETVTCLRLRRMHLINPSTGKVLGAEAALSAWR